LKHAAAKERKDKILEIDRNRKEKYHLSDIDKENIEKNTSLLTQAKQMMDEDHDCVKDMNKMVLYSKVATIRDKQKEETKVIHHEYKKQEMKMDLMMELERLKELKFQEERERVRKDQQRSGALIIVDQIKERELDRLRAKEVLERERQLMMKQIHELEEEDVRIADMKKEQGEKLSKEVEETNRKAIEMKERKKIEEKELELKIHQYNVEKSKREEEEMAEKRRVQDEKEKEVQKLREKQERAQDKQAELDAIRAKRAYEEAERAAREKEKMEIIIRQRKVVDLLDANERQKMDKELKLAEQAKHEQEEYGKIITKQIKDLESERRKEEERKKMRYDHNWELRRQIKEKEEVERLGKRENLEEGRKMKQKIEAEKKKLNRIKDEKLDGLKGLHINPKYTADLERYKVK